MAFVKHNGIRKGDWVVTTRVIDCLTGYFEKGTKVRVVVISPKGYVLEDEGGNRISTCGFDCVTK